MSNYTNNLFDPKVKNNSWTHIYDFVPKGARVLDVGCSSGHFGEVLIHEKNCEVTGIDLDAPDIALAKKILTNADIRNIEKDDISDLGTFDVIMFIDVLEHLLDPIGALNKVKKQLTKNGVVLFSIPNMAHISVRLHLLKGFFEYTPIGVLDRTHLHYYDEFEVEHIFSEANLQIAEINAVTKPYPDSRISEVLYNMGLGIIDRTFFAHLKETKADVFQFVGIAKPVTEGTEVKRPQRYLMPPEEMHTTLVARDKELQKLGKRLHDANTQVEKLTAENKQYEDFYRNPIKGSARRIASKLKPKRRHS